MDVLKVRKDFPMLNKVVNGHKLVYFDNAATAQIPTSVTQAICAHITNSNANVHRGIHSLSEENSTLYEQAREYVAEAIGARSAQEIVFTSGTTDSINMVAASLMQTLDENDEIVTTVAEHHSNFIPWQQCANHKSATMKVVPLDKNGGLDLMALEAMLSSRTKLLAVSQCSNVLGIANNIKEICRIAHAKGVPVLVDGAQGIVHMHVDVQELDCDWYCFSGHKLMSTTGIGVLYAKKHVLEQMPPVRFGGGMVQECSIENSLWEEIPSRFEAGTPNYIGAYGLVAALKYRHQIGFQAALAHESSIISRIEKGLRNIKGIHILGETKERTGCISFTLKNIHPFDIATFLDQHGIAVRSGSLCAKPLLRFLRYEHVVRISPTFYNTKEEVDFFLNTLEATIRLLRGESC